MSFSEFTANDPTLAALVNQVIVQHGTYMSSGRKRWLLVDVARQRLILMQDRKAKGCWPVSTASVGLDNRQGSGGTPPGAHRIDRKIGADCPSGTVFVSREPTGEVWQPGPDSPPDDLILTRILTLVGCEPGVNLGPGIDSRERYIYLHGTNHEHRIGEPASHGCVRLTSTDISEVFAQVQEGDPVVIV